MTWLLLSADMVEAIHDTALNPGELPGRARDKSLDGALGRVENRVVYGFIGDIFDLAAAYAIAISQGHCFNDGNNRIAFHSMVTVLELQGIDPDWPQPETGDTIIRAAQGHIDEPDLAEWLRGLTGSA